MVAGLQLVLAIDHHGLIGFEPGIDQRLALADLGDAYRAHLDRLVIGEMT